MDRATYNACIGNAMRGRQLTRQERKAAFCIASKVCSGKAANEEEAGRICALPKAARAAKTKPNEPQLPCADRMARVKNSLETMELKVKSGQAEEVVDLAKQTLGDVETCVAEPGTVELFREAMDVVKKLGSGGFYIIGEAKDVKSKFNILKELV